MNISNPYIGERRARQRRACPLPRTSLDASSPCPMARSASYSKVPTSSPATGAAKKPPAPPSSTAGSAPATSPSALPDGYYTLCGRKSDLIISGGFNIYPREIEEFLQEQEEVAEAAVVAWPIPSAAKSPWPTSSAAATSIPPT